MSNISGRCCSSSSLQAFAGENPLYHQSLQSHHSMSFLMLTFHPESFNLHCSSATFIIDSLSLFVVKPYTGQANLIRRIPDNFCNRNTCVRSPLGGLVPGRLRDICKFLREVACEKMPNKPSSTMSTSWSLVSPLHYVGHTDMCKEQLSILSRYRRGMS